MSSDDTYKRIACVTGASGMIGSKIVDRLVEGGYTVRVLSRQESFDNPQVQFFQGGLEDVEVLRSFVQDARLLFHCAAELRDESKMWDVNVLGTKRLLKIIAGTNIEYMCFLSSSGVFGRTAKKWIHENDTCIPQTVYEKSKWAAEELVRKGIEGCRIVILRPGTVISEEKPGHIMGPVRSLLTEFKVFFVGGEFSHLVHAEDVAHVATSLIDMEPEEPRCYNVSYDDDALNTYGGIWALYKQVRAGRDDALVKQAPHLPLIIPYWIRKLRRGYSNRGDVRFSSKKLFADGYRFDLGLQGLVQRLVEFDRVKTVQEKKQPKRRLIPGGRWAFAGKMVTTAAGLVINALLARLLSPEDFGAYFIILAMVMFAAILAQVGMSQTVVRFVAESLGTGRPARAAKAILLCLSYVLIGSLVVFLGFNLGLGQWLALHIFDSELIGNVIGITSIWIIFMAFQNIAGETFRGFHDIQFATISGGTLTSILSAVFFGVLWGIRGHSDVGEVILFSIIACGINLVIAATIIQKRYKKIRGKTSLQSQEIFQVALPLFLTNLMLFALIQADVWILGAFDSKESVAAYGAVSRLVLPVTIPLLIVNAVIQPIIAELKATGQDRMLESILRTTAPLAFIPVLPVFLFFLFCGGGVLELLFGSFYRDGYLILVILSIGQIIYAMTGSPGIVLMMSGYQKLMMYISIFCGVFVVVGSLLAVTLYGMIGVACFTALGYIMQGVLMMIAVKVKIGIWTYIDLSVSKIKNNTLKILSNY